MEKRQNASRLIIRTAQCLIENNILRSNSKWFTIAFLLFLYVVSVVYEADFSITHLKVRFLN